MPPKRKVKRGKRKRENDDSCHHHHQEEAQGPQIRGVPASLSPVLIEAVKSCRPPKVVHRQPTAAAAAAADNKNNEEDVVSRVLANSGVTSSSKTTKPKTPEKPWWHNRNTDDNAQLRTFLREASHLSHPGGGGGDDFYGSLVLTRILEFVLDIVVATEGPHTTPARLRRGALAVASELLHRSTVCRRYFCCGDQNHDHASTHTWIKRIVDMLLAPTHTPHGNHNQANHTECLLLETKHMLLTLQKQYGTYYPRLTVSLRRLRDKMGVLNAYQGTHRTTNNIHHAHSDSTFIRVGGGMTKLALRMARDAALSKGQQECQTIAKLIKEADALFHQIVPRHPFAEDHQQQPPHLPLDQHGDEQHHQVSSVPWQDGNATAKSNTTTTTPTQTPQEATLSREEHEAAVERTLAAMGWGNASSSSSAGLFVQVALGGEVANEHDLFDASSLYQQEENVHGYNQHDDDDDEDEEEEDDIDWDDGDPVQPPNTDEKRLPQQQQQQTASSSLWNQQDSPTQSTTNPIFKTLSLCIQKLTSVHMPRLSLWMEALTKADNLPLHVDNGNNNNNNNNSKKSRNLNDTLVHTAKKRGRILQLLMAARAEAAGCVATASKLEGMLLLGSEQGMHGTTTTNTQQQHQQQQQGQEQVDGGVNGGNFPNMANAYQSSPASKSLAMFTFTSRGTVENARSRLMARNRKNLVTARRRMKISPGLGLKKSA